MIDINIIRDECPVALIKLDEGEESGELSYDKGLNRDTPNSRIQVE